MKIGIVGAGIVGLTHAHEFLKFGAQVKIFEASDRARGASVRNFGMVWPVGQANQDLRNLALRSRSLWLSALSEAGIYYRTCGSIHLAYHDLELQVLREFVELCSDPETGLDIRLGSPKEILLQVPHLENSSSLKGGMISTSEVSVDPRTTVGLFSNHLTKKGVQIEYSTPVSRVQGKQVALASGRIEEFDLVLITAGPELSQLLPETCHSIGLVPCQLQMMRFVPKPGTPRIHFHLCAGHTLRHYANFKICPSLPALTDLHSELYPLQVKHAIHVLVAEHEDGCITVGDSHQYGEERSPYGVTEIDEAILAALSQFFPIHNYTRTHNWTGTYNTHPDLPYVQQEVEPGVWALNVFGTGMTLSFGIAEQTRIAVLG